MTLQYGGNSASWGSGAIGGAVLLDNKTQFFNGLSTQVHLATGSFGWQHYAAAVRYGNGKFAGSTRLFFEKAENDFTFQIHPDLPEKKQEHAALQQQGVLQEFFWNIKPGQALALRAWLQNTDREIPPTLVQNRSEATQADEFLRTSLHWKRTGKTAVFQARAAFFSEKIDYRDELIGLESLTRFHTWMGEAEATWFWGKQFRLQSSLLQTHTRADAPAKKIILSERSNFPTDLYIAEALAREQGCELVLVDWHELPDRLDDRVAVLMLTHVNYRTGRIHDMELLTQLAHRAGALALWDLAHSAGAVPVDLTAAHADFAVGCGYKYLNGGPGAPAFVWVHPRHAERFWQPLAGWMGHAAPFEFKPGYRPAAGISRYLCGTPPVVSMAALECGVDTLLAAGPLGGMAALRRKSIALTRLFAELVQSRCGSGGFTIASPLLDDERGSQICLARTEGAYAIVQALIARGVIGDFRAPDILRFGFTPLYTRFVDAWDAVEHLVQVMQHGEWQRPEFNVQRAVT